ncbi:MAG: ribosome silencing factor [Verrucomicrobia bacterium]|nr:ribosome silencing factor [Verrucomicrobiota bacterium]
MDSRRLAQRCRELADSKKAENIVVLDVRKISCITDYFVLATGLSESHLRAVVDEIGERMRSEFRLIPRATDGSLQTAWVVLDYFDVIVHIMRADVRERYDLEGLWGDAPRVSIRNLGSAPKRSRSAKASPAPKAKRVR